MRKFLEKVVGGLVVLVLILGVAVTPVKALGTPSIDSVSPPSGSPVGSNVCIRVSINWDDEYRAMRVRLGSEGWQESSETSFERCFNTTGWSSGTYQIRVEADRKTGDSWSNPNVTTANYELTAGSGGGGGGSQPTNTPSGGSIPYGPSISQISFSPSGGAAVGTNVNVHIKVDSNNPGAISITPSCGNTAHAEHTVPEFDTTWYTQGCGGGEQFIKVCARHKDDPNWAYATCKKGFYQLSSPPAQAPAADFWADDTSLLTGECTLLRWETSNATQVDIDGTIVSLDGSMQVCPTITKRYSLKAIGSGGTATRSLTIDVSVLPASTSPPPTSSTSSGVQSSFQTGDVIQIGGDIYVIANGFRRLVPNPETLDALGISRSLVNNRGYSSSQLQEIPRSSDIPDVNRDRTGFDAFKATYFPNAIPIVPGAQNPPSGGTTPPSTGTGEAQGNQTGSSSDSFYGFCSAPQDSGGGFWEWLRETFHIAVAEGRENEFKEGECTALVAKKRPDIFACLPPSGAHAHTWDESAEECGFPVDKKPQFGDAAVWGPYCGTGVGKNGHVAYVTWASADGKKIIVEEDNWSPSRAGQEINVLSCMSFIHQKVVENTSSQPVQGEAVCPSWVPDFFCGIYVFIFGK